MVPVGPLVEPLTCPLPAVIEADKPPAEAVPLCAVATLQLEPWPLPVTTVLLEPPELAPTLTELLEVCAVAVAAPRPKSATDSRKAFTGRPPTALGGRLRGRHPAQPIVTVR